MITALLKCNIRLQIRHKKNVTVPERRCQIAFGTDEVSEVCFVLTDVIYDDHQDN